MYSLRKKFKRKIKPKYGGKGNLDIAQRRTGTTQNIIKGMVSKASN